MRSLQGCRRQDIILGIVTLCLAAVWALQSVVYTLKSPRSPAIADSVFMEKKGGSVLACDTWDTQVQFPPLPQASFVTLAQRGVSLLVPQPNINASVTQNILLSVEYSCKGIATVEWKHVSSWGTNKIVEWKPGSYTNISKSYKERVNTYENGSIQLLNVGVRDAGYYVVTITEDLGTNVYGTIILSVYEIIYEDLHFVAVFFAFLTAVSAVLVCFMWFCNKSVHLFQNKRHKLTARTAEEIELQTIEC